MGYYCRDCGNTETFSAIQNFTEYGYENVTMDGEGEILDWNDREVTDSEQGEIEDLECGECGSSNVVWEDDDEVLQNEISCIKGDRIEEIKSGKELLGD